MKIPIDALIPIEKLTRYLLLPREYDDKSKFLSLAGFTLRDPAFLLQAIRDVIRVFEAFPDGSNAYGIFFRVDGILIGPKGQTLSIRTIWLRRKADGLFHFVTLKPLKRG